MVLRKVSNLKMELNFKDLGLQVPLNVCIKFNICSVNSGVDASIKRIEHINQFVYFVLCLILNVHINFDKE